jgi:hypothetical protein
MQRYEKVVPHVRQGGSSESGCAEVVAARIFGASPGGSETMLRPAASARHATMPQRGDQYEKLDASHLAAACSVVRGM